MDIRVGSILKIKNLEAKVIGRIKYKNTQDGDKTWTEYRLQTDSGERWLSVDDIYKEYSISWADNKVRGNIGPEWHEVDRGHQVVVSCSGDVDVENGDEAEFVEFEDASEDRTLSVEIWDDGTEYSKGEYIELSDIQVIGYEKPKFDIYRLLGSQVFWYAVCFLGLIIFCIADSLPPIPKRISNYLRSDSQYAYETSITGNARQKADVYKYVGKGDTNLIRNDGTDPTLVSSYYFTTTYSTDMVAKDIIKGIDGMTESVTQEDDEDDAPIAIVTDKEYCLIYHPEDEKNTVYVQISKRKYNYTSDNSPYRSSEATTHWYRSHYYSSSYTADSTTYHSSPSAYTMYSGDTIHNIGNGYFDSYSSSVRQSSINSRSSSSGGGK